MSRMSEMSGCIADLKAAASALLSVAETLTVCTRARNLLWTSPRPSPSPKRKSGRGWHPRAPQATAHRYAPCSESTVHRSFPL